MAANGDSKKPEAPTCELLFQPLVSRLSTLDTLLMNLSAAYDKQKVLLSSDAGHFSLIRALHLADLITELNGKQNPTPLSPLS